MPGFGSSIVLCPVPFAAFPVFPILLLLPVPKDGSHNKERRTEAPFRFLRLPADTLPRYKADCLHDAGKTPGMGTSAANGGKITGNAGMLLLKNHIRYFRPSHGIPHILKHEK